VLYKSRCDLAGSCPDVNLFIALGLRNLVELGRVNVDRQS
jgi:hypothetical protein